MANSTNSTSDENVAEKHAFYDRLFLELFTAIGLLSIISVIILLVVIIKSKRLRREVSNKILLNASLVQAIYLASAILGARILKQYEFIANLNDQVVCVAAEIENVFLFSNFLFLILLICDWYMKVYSGGNKYRRFCGVYKFFIGGIYMFAFFLSSLTVQLCIKRVYPRILAYTGISIFLSMILILIAMNITHRFKSRRGDTQSDVTNSGLAIANIFILLWLPALFMLVLIIFGFEMPVLIIVAICIGFSSPTCNLLYLFYYDDDYNISIKRIFRCDCRENENEHVESFPITYNDDGTIKILDN